MKASAKLKNKDMIDGITVYRYSAPLDGPFIYFRRPLISAWRALLFFRKIINNDNFDLLNIHSTIPAAFILKLPVAKKMAKVFTFHASIYQEIVTQKTHKKYSSDFMLAIILKVVRFLEKSIFNQCENIITLSEFTRNQLIELYNINQSKIKIIFGAVDVEKFKIASNKSDVRKQLNLPVDKNIFFCVRRLVARMGLENLIRAVEFLKRDSVEFVLCIGGRGYLKGALSQLIKDKNMEENVKLMGFIDDEDLPKYYQAADLFILPTKELEGFGLVTLESLASGVPVIGTSVGGTKEIIIKFDGRFLFTSLEPKTMSADIQRVLKIIKEETFLSTKCRQFVIDNYSWNNKVKEIEAVFKDAIWEKTHDE
jgi:glycosyltransferase involved in cell wall biosynthesis